MNQIKSIRLVESLLLRLCAPIARLKSRFVQVRDTQSGSRYLGAALLWYAGGGTMFLHVELGRYLLILPVWRAKGKAKR